MRFADCLVAMSDDGIRFGKVHSTDKFDDYEYKCHKLDNLSKSVKDKENKRSISLTINVKKDKIATVKDSAGKVSEYKITLNTEVKIIDFFNNNKLLEDTLIASTSYKVQSQYSETLNLENKSIDDLINNIYRNLLIKLTQTLSDK